MRRLVLVAMVMMVAGCAQESAKPPAATMASEARPAGSEKTASSPQSRERSREPFASSGNIEIAETPTAVQVTIYQLAVPYGAVSRNEAFWKRIDEQCVDVTTHDTLFKNGVRVGKAPTSEWEYFRKIMEAHPAVTRMNSLVSLEGKTVELPVTKDVQGQNIFYFDSAGTLHGRSYEGCENVITMVVQAAPRKRDTVRLTLCPVVRSMRKRLEYSSLNRQGPEIAYTNAEHLYDLNLRADIPADAFFIVAPSGEATWPTSVGNSFLIHEGAADRMETVLLLVPQIMKMGVGTMPAK